MVLELPAAGGHAPSASYSVPNCRVLGRDFAETIKVLNHLMLRKHDNSGRARSNQVSA